MQRRVAFAYLAFFVVMGASAYSVIAVADAPAISVEGETLETGSALEVDGRQYTVSNLSGGGDGGSYAGTLTYTNDSYVFTETLEHNSTIDYRNESYRVDIPNESSPGSFRLVEQLDTEAILANDTVVDNQTYTDDDGTEFVRYENGTTQPLSEYLPEPRTVEFAVGDEIDYADRTMTVATLTREAATLEAVGSETIEVELAQGENVTLSGTQYLANFHGSGDDVRVTLAPAETQYDNYQREVARQEYFHERMNGLWGVVILSGLAGMFVVSLALLPVKG